jgi:hypothetical protein
VIRWCHGQAHKATAEEDKAKLGWLDAHLAGKVKFQLGCSSCRRTGRIRCWLAPREHRRLLWKTNPFQRPSADAGCASKPVIAVTNLWPIG